MEDQVAISLMIWIINWGAVPPEAGPTLSGQDAFYRPGQKVNVNCTSQRSKPAAALHWYLNGEKVSAAH